MTMGGKKRKRSERVASLELPPNRWEQAWTSLRRLDVLGRIGLALLTALFLCALIRGWQEPFAFRSGTVPSRDVTARVPFTLEDPEQTREKEDRARWQVRYVYENDPEPLRRLRDTLRNTVLEAMSADTFAELDPKIWAEFQPPSEQDAPLSEEERKKLFETFRAAIADEEERTTFEKNISAALAPFERTGLLESLSSTPVKGNQDEIVVFSAAAQPSDSQEPLKPSDFVIVKVSDVLIGNGAAVRDGLNRHLNNADMAEAVFNWLKPRLSKTLSLDDERTKNALDEAVADVKPVIVNYERGQLLAEGGQPLTDEQIRKLKAEHLAADVAEPLGRKIYRFASITTLILVLFAFVALYLQHRKLPLLIDLKRQGMVLAIMAIALALSRWASIDPWRAEIIPLLLFGQIVAIAYRRELALLLSGVLAFILVTGLGQGLWEFITLLAVTATVVLQLERIRSRPKLIYVGFFGCLVAFVLTVCAGVLNDQPLNQVLLMEAAWNVLWTLAASCLMTVLLPFVERLFGVLTDISLLELGNVSHPLLQELVRRAPSTYNHSITVGSIAEAAADAIGARGLLVRVGAYFHDIGKMLKPTYFIENQPPDDNVHEALLPQMSTLVIVAHIKDGADLARQHRLPEPIIEFIEQHHGTTLVEFFFGRASKQSELDPNGAEVEEAAFRYPGPKPQTKEAAVLMLADAAESACRSLVEPGSARIESLVREVAERKLQDGQFDESGLTLRELRTIEDSMIKSLIANYHGRIKYPDQRTA
jgi:cyclic-di-AMP phosphodiesterase PgpH